jgi:hypothetical protein
MEWDDRERTGETGGPGTELDRLVGDLPAETTSFLQAQYQAVERSLERYLDERIRDFRSSRSYQGSAVATGTRLGRLGELFVRFRPEIYLLLTLGLVGLLWVAGGTRSPEGQPPPTGSERSRGGEGGEGPRDPAAGGAAAPSLLAAETLAAVREDPDGAWRRMVESDRARYAEWLGAVSEARGLEPGRVSDLQRRRFAEYAERASGPGPLPGEVLRYSRIGLFEYVYGLFERTQRGANNRGFRVTLAFEDYDPALLRALLDELSLAESFAGELDAQDPALQAAVLGRRLAGEVP